VSAAGTRAGPLAEVFRFELGYRLRQASTWIYAAVLFGVPFLMMHAINGSSQYLNAPEMVMKATGILGGIGMIVSAGVFGDAAARDVQSRMYALFYTSPLREAHYVVGRFLGAAAVNAVLLLGIPHGLLLASVMPYMKQGQFGPVQLSAYVQAYALMLFPNLVLIGACMFTAAALARRALATYVGGLVLYVLALLAGDLTDGFSNRTLSALADPFGGAAITEVTRFWTPAERNAVLIGWPELMLWNRAIWLAVACGVLALLVARFRFVQPKNVAQRRWWRRPVVDTGAVGVGERLAPLAISSAGGAERSFSLAARARQTLAVAARAWREIAATRAFLVILAGALAFVFIFGWDVGAEVFGTSMWPVTHLIAGTVLSTALGPVMAVLIAIFAGELVWRERDVGMGDIADVAPVPNSVALLGRFLALVAMLVVLQCVLAGAGVLLQTLRGYPRYEPLVYLKILFGIKLADYVILAALAMAVHVIVNNKYVGHLVVVLIFASTMVSGLIGLQDRLLIYGSDPGWIWSDLNGLAPFLEGLVWLKLYWAAWALLLTVLASLFWTRGRERGVARRLALARQRLRGPALRAAAVAVTLVVSLGGFVFYNTHVLNAYESPDEADATSAEYERRYKRYENAPQPGIETARLRVELHPQDRAAEIRGTYVLVNRTIHQIDSLHVLLHPDAWTRTLSFDHAARMVVDDSVQRYRIYALEQELAPGDSVAMSFDVALRPRGFRNAGAATDVTSNGTYFERTRLPMLGYQAGREIMDEEQRRKQGLPPRTQEPDAGDVDARDAGGRAVELTDVETVIGTDPAQIAVTPGVLVREWRENGRRYFHYRTDAPIRFSGTILSAEYAVKQDAWNGIPLRLLHHPTHDVNAARMLRSMRSSLAYYSEKFGPYQFRELRVVEFPRFHSLNARAHPGTIIFSEGGAFLTRVDSGEVDRTFFVIAHETAHQWWGGQVTPAAVAGAGMVSETLAQYSAMMVLEQEYGAKMAREFYDYNMGMYLSGRTVFTNREAPLLDVKGQQYVHYFKGAVVMYTLRERLGADAVNGALRRFRERYTGPDAPPATSRALYAELRAVTPDSLRPLLSDLVEHITLWSMRTDSVRAEPDGAGAWRTTLYVDASKARADSVGRQTPIPMDDLVEVGVCAEQTGNPDGLREPLYLKQHRVRSGKQTITVFVPRRPARAGVDPNRQFIERERSDNLAAVGSDVTRADGR
jgi:ABC-type transport system involved in multi-copper enzyme maturation permease subunit